jgi:transaldolase
VWKEPVQGRRDPLPADGGNCEEMLDRFRRAGIDIDALAVQLQREGAEAFDQSWNDLLECIASKRAALKKAG